MAHKVSRKRYKGVGTILSYLKPHKRELMVLAGLSMAAALGNAVVPYLGGRLFDVIIRQSSASADPGASYYSVLVILGIWLGANLVSNVADWFKQHRQERLAVELETDYTVHGFSTLLRFPMSFHKRQKVGEITQRINRASDRVEQLAKQILIDLAPQFFSIFIAIAITFSIKPVLAFLLVGAVALYTIVLFHISPRLARLSRKMHTAYSRAHGETYDTVMNVQAVKQASAEDYERRKIFRNFKVRAGNLWVEFISVGSNLNFSQRLIVTFTQAILFSVSVFLIRRGELTVGQLVAFNGYSAMLFGPFVALGRNWDLIQNGLVAIERSEEILRLPQEEYTPKDAVILSDIRGEVEFRAVHFRYSRGQNYVLNGISFHIMQGMSVALVGESGVGKSTLTELISFYYRPTSGKVLVDGHDVSRLDLASLRSRIAVVPQELMLFNDTVKNNIRYGKFGASDADVGDAAQKAHADEFIERFPKKYNQKVGERGIKLSVGQKQRLAIARAILRDPKILVLDEPTSALDAKSERFISESLEKLMAGRTTFIIAHRLSTVRKADIILVLAKGLIVESGTHDELIRIKNGAYRRLYELQIGLK